MNFADETWERISRKTEKTVMRNRTGIPYTTQNGRFDDKSTTDISWWTNGFWPGMLWLMYHEEKKELYAKTAGNAEKQLDKALREYVNLHHDVGFMYHLSAGASYRLTQNAESKVRELYAANILAGRYNMRGGYIRAWNPWEGESHIGWSIIDCLMNLPLLYAASEICGDPRYAYVAQAHADMAIRDHVRDDGSVRHIVIHDPETGEMTGEPGGQGYGTGSVWSRGQAWAVYGFVLNYIHTGERRYLDAAKRTANCFIACVCDDWLTPCDFRAPKEPKVYDSSAGLIAACGMIEIAKAVGELEADTYKRAAVNLLKATVENFCDWDEERDAIVTMFTESYHNKETRHISSIYADFFLVEAILKLRGSDFLIW